MSRVDPAASALPWPQLPRSAAFQANSAGPEAQPQPHADLPFVRGMRVDEIGPDKSDLPEPSGVVFHPGRGTLFVVGDRGHVAELSLDGTVLARERLGKRDLEGITVGPEGRLYCVQEEDPPALLELDPATLEITRRFRIRRKLDGERVLARKHNHGLEGVVWVEQQRAFYVVNQAKPAALVRLDVPLDDPEGGKARPVSVIDLASIVHHGAADVHWDLRTGHFLVLESLPSGRGKLHEIAPDGRLVRTIAVPGDRPEGFTLDAHGAAYITQDGGGLLRIRR